MILFWNAFAAEGGITKNQWASFRHIHDEQEFQQALWRVMQQTRWVKTDAGTTQAVASLIVLGTQRDGSNNSKL